VKLLTYCREVVVGGRKFTIREPVNVNDYRKLMDVQLRIWGMPDYSEAVTYHMIIAGHRNGGLALGVYNEDGEVVGLAFGVPGYDNGLIYLYSHLLGVIPESRFQGVGYELKISQRELALSKGYSLIKWTYDPMQSPNAYFNICKFGVVVRSFHEDYYGELIDELNRGMPSDRFEAEWWIKSARVAKVLNGEVRHPSIDELDKLGAFTATKVRVVNDVTLIESIELSNKSDLVLVEIPGDLNYLKKVSLNEAVKWRLLLRKAFNYYINSMGYVVTWFISFIDGGVRRSYYILWRRNLREILRGGFPWS